MVLLDIIRRRRSIRKYLDKPIEDEKLQLILEAARLAPSSTNTQPWHFVVVRDKEKISKLAKSMPLGSERFINSFIEQAPVVVVAIGQAKLSHRFSKLFSQDNHIIDVAIALEHMVLQATELDIGSCWIGWFNKKKVIEVLKLGRRADIVAMLTLGYPVFPSTADAVGSASQKPRKSLNEIVSYQ
ncbi:MAG: nitroreductase family protein [bacterium]